jgi:hypothetical protein
MLHLLRFLDAVKCLSINLLKIGVKKMRFFVILIAGFITAQSPTLANIQKNSDWLRISSLPDDTHKIQNALHIQETKLRWNGEVMSDDQVNTLLRVLAEKMSPQDQFILSYDEAVSPKKVAYFKKLVDRKLKCNPSICLELSSKSN